MFTRLFGGFVLVLALLLALDGTAMAQKRTAVGADSVVPLNLTASTTGQHVTFVDVAGNRVCVFVGYDASNSPTVACSPLPIIIPAGAPVVPLNPSETINSTRFFVVGTGAFTTTLCAVTGAGGVTVCTASPF
jgi:hypothetical protein